MKPEKYTILLLLAGLVAVLFMGSVSAADTYVNDSVTTSGDGSSWTQAYKTILEGYNGVTDGGTVNIASGTYTGGGNNLISVDKNITIQGAGANQTKIDLQGANYAFRINNYKNVTIKDLTIQNGNNEPNNGGALFNYNYGTLYVENVIFKDNKAGSGGAINNYYGNLTVTNCTFTGNNATSNEEGAGGGAIYNTGNLIITGSIFNSNNALNGGAIFAYSITNITGANFFENTANSNGGAIYSSNDLSVKYSRFVGNTVANNPNDIYTQYYGLIATLNWWGSNTGPASGRITGSEGSPGPYAYTPWLMLNIKADPSTIYTGQASTITADVYTDSAGVDHSADAAQFFSGPEITLSTNLGTIGSNSITVPWVLGQAVRPLLADEGPGIATVTAADVQTVQTTVTMLQDPTKVPENEVNAASNTVGMQETGLPVNYLVMAVLLIIGGLLVPKKK